VVVVVFLSVVVMCVVGGGVKMVAGNSAGLSVVGVDSGVSGVEGGD